MTSFHTIVINDYQRAVTNNRSCELFPQKCEEKKIDKQAKLFVGIYYLGIIWLSLICQYPLNGTK